MITYSTNWMGPVSTHWYEENNIPYVLKMTDDISFDTQGNIKFESVDTIVTDQLTNINSEQYSPNMLLDIYRNL